MGGLIVLEESVVDVSQTFLSLRNSYSAMMMCVLNSGGTKLSETPYQ